MDNKDVENKAKEVTEKLQSNEKIKSASEKIQNSEKLKSASNKVAKLSIWDKIPMNTMQIVLACLTYLFMLLPFLKVGVEVFGYSDTSRFNCFSIMFGGGDADALFMSMLLLVLPVLMILTKFVVVFKSHNNLIFWIVGIVGSVYPIILRLSYSAFSQIDGVSVHISIGWLLIELSYILIFLIQAVKKLKTK